MNDITSFQTLIGSLYKKFNRASVYGKLNLKELYILDIVNELLYDCPTCFNEQIKNKLQSLAIQLQNLDPEICAYKEDRDLYVNITNQNFSLNNRDIKLENTAPIVDDNEETDPPTPATIVLERQEKEDILDSGYKTYDGFIITTSTPNDTIIMKLTYLNDSPECPHPETLVAKDYSSGSNETSEAFGHEETVYLTIHTNGSGVSERWLFDYVNIPMCVSQGTIYVSVLESELSLINPDNQTIEINTI